MTGMSGDLDDKDRMILRELRRDAGQKTTALAKRVGLPRTTVHERIAKLQEEGIIRRWTVLLDHKKLDRGVTAFIFVGFAAGGVDQRTLAQKIAEFPEVSEVFVVSGEWDILIKVRASTLQGIGDLIVDKLRAMPGVARTMTATSFETIKEEP